MDLEPTPIPGPAVPPPAPPQRAGDAEREQTADALRVASADGRLTVEELEERLTATFAARTRPELEALLADVSGVEQLGAPAAAKPVAGEKNGTRWTVAIMSGARRAGAWRPARKSTVVSIMGGSEIDLTKAELTHPITTIRVIAIMGGSEIRVPEGASVHVSKLGIMGGNDVRLGDVAPPPGAPELHLKLLAIMGGNDVRQGPKRRRSKDRDRHRHEHRHHHEHRDRRRLD